MTKTLKKTIIYRSQLETKYLKAKSQVDLETLIRQKMFYSNLYKKGRNYYESLAMKHILDNKDFEKRWHHFCSIKTQTFLKLA